MWFSPLGYRKLCNAEAELFKNAVLSLLEHQDEMYKLNSSYHSGVLIFDDLTYNQQIFCLNEVAEYLLTDKEIKDEPCAFLDGTIGAIFSHIFTAYVLETEGASMKDNNFFWRKLIFDACKQDEEINKDIIEKYSSDREWQSLIYYLKDRILWDEDYDNSNLYDLPPEEKRAIFDYLGIYDFYYIQIPDDPNNYETQKLRRNIEILCKS